MWMSRVVATAAAAAVICAAVPATAQAQSKADDGGPAVTASVSGPVIGGVGPAVHLCGLCWPVIN